MGMSTADTTEARWPSRQRTRLVTLRLDHAEVAQLTTVGRPAGLTPGRVALAFVRQGLSKGTPPK